MWHSDVAGLLVYDPCTKRMLLGQERDGWGPLTGRRERADADSIDTAIREAREESCDALHPTREQFDRAYRGTLITRTPRGLTCALYVLVPWWSAEALDPVRAHAENRQRETRLTYLEKTRLHWAFPSEKLPFRARFGQDLHVIRPMLRAIAR